VAKILLVEDDPNFAYVLKNNLEIDGHQVELAADGRASLDRIASGHFDLVVLDLRIPEPNGLEVLKMIRLRGDQVRVIVLTALTEEINHIRGLKIGADDFVPKTDGLVVFLARVEACLRRPPVSQAMAARAAAAAAELYGTDLPGDHSPTVIGFGSCVIDPAAQLVLRDDEVVDLRPKEFELLLALARRPGCVLKRADLLQDVWRYDKGAKTRTLDVHVAALRRKLEEHPRRPRHIITIPRRGYRFEP